MRCLDDIPSGGFICVYAGQLLTEKGANEVRPQAHLHEILWQNASFGFLCARSKGLPLFNLLGWSEVW